MRYLFAPSIPILGVLVQLNSEFMLYNNKREIQKNKASGELYRGGYGLSVWGFAVSVKYKYGHRVSRSCTEFRGGVMLRQAQHDNCVTPRSPRFNRGLYGSQPTVHS